MEVSFYSPFLEAFEILPWSGFDDGASGTVFKVVRRPGAVLPVSGVSGYGPVLIVKLVNLPPGPAKREFREVELLEDRGVENENVIKIFGSWEERPPLGFEYPNRPAVNQRGARLLFILMEYCDLFTLRRWLGWPREKRSWTDLVNIFVQVTKGLEAIHTKGIIHRDLKPSNVGLQCHWKDERVLAKLIDFGLATKHRDVMTSKTGTHHYRSPESHNGRRYDEKADVYALGIILCQMIASFSMDGMSCSKLEDEFRQFVEERMSSSYSPSPFDAETYLQKYFVTDGGNRQVTEMIQLAKNMTSRDPQERPTAVEIQKTVKEIIPVAEDVKVCIYNYLEEVKVNQLWFATEKPADLRPIRTSRLNHVTHLTLKNICLTKQQLLETIKECFVIKHLSLSVEIPDFRDDELLPMPSVRLPHLRTFRFRVHFEGSERNTTPPLNPVRTYGVPRMKSLMFFGPLSQIWEKEMRVKVSCGSLTIVNIDARQELFFLLDGINSGFEFLEVLNHVQFQQVSLQRLSGEPEEEIMELNQLWSAENMKSVYDLNLVLPALDFMEGRFLDGFSFLTELSMTTPYFISSRSKKHVPFHTILLPFLPETLTRLFLKMVIVCIDGVFSQRRLEVLELIDCVVPCEFYERYEELFEIENLRVVTKSSLIEGGSAVPGFPFMESVLDTSNWNTVILDPFDWKETNDNCEFRGEFIESFFPQEDEESLKDKGIFLELIDGKQNAQMTEMKSYGPPNVSRNPWNKWEKVDLEYPEDSDDEEGRLLVGRGLADPIDEVDARQLLSAGLETLDNTLEANFGFKGSLKYPSYPETGWESLLEFEIFKGIPKDKLKPNLKQIHLRDCSLSASFPLQMKGCVNLESLVMVNVDSAIFVKMTCKLPALKIYTVNFYSTYIPHDIHADYFTFERFDQLWFFRSRPERVKGLWGKGIETRVSVQGTLYFQLDKTSLVLQFLPEVSRILSLLDLNETLEKLKVHCCLFKLPNKVLPPSITKLILRYVEATFRSVCESGSQLRSLKTLIFEGREDHHFVDVACIESFPSLKHLTLCNVRLSELLNKVKIPLESCTLSRVKVPMEENERSFNATFPSFLISECLVLANGVNNSFNYKTIYSVLTSEEISMKSVTFINYGRTQLNPEASENDLGKNSFSELFLANHGILGKHFKMQLEDKSSRKWRVEEITPDESDDDLLEGYLETLPFFQENDKERRRENLKSLRQRESVKEGYFVYH